MWDPRSLGPAGTLDPPVPDLGAGLRDWLIRDGVLAVGRAHKSKDQCGGLHTEKFYLPEQTGGEMKTTRASFPTKAPPGSDLVTVCLNVHSFGA